MNIGKLIDSLKAESVEMKGEKVVLKRAIAKGKFQLMHKDVIFKKKIGAGAYGTVYRGRLVKTNEVIAVKKLDPEGTDEEGLAEMMKEARVMQLYDHPNIVKFHGFILDDLPYLLVLEFCNGGAVEDQLREKGPVSLYAFFRSTMTFRDSQSRPESVIPSWLRVEWTICTRRTASTGTSPPETVLFTRG